MNITMLLCLLLPSIRYAFVWKLLAEGHCRMLCIEDLDPVSVRILQPKASILETVRARTMHLAHPEETAVHSLN